MKAKALTLFGSAPVGAEQPLEAPLAALMTRVRQQLAQIRRGCEELRLNLEVQFPQDSCRHWPHNAFVCARTHPAECGWGFDSISQTGSPP